MDGRGYSLGPRIEGASALWHLDAGNRYFVGPRMKGKLFPGTQDGGREGIPHCTDWSGVSWALNGRLRYSVEPWMEAGSIPCILYWERGYSLDLEWREQVCPGPWKKVGSIAQTLDRGSGYSPEP